MSEYKPIDVSLEFDLHSDGSVKILWRGAALFGETATAFVPPYDQTTLPVVMQALDALQSRRTMHNLQHQQLLARHNLWANNQIAPSATKIVGRALYDALGIEGQHMLRQVHNRGISDDRAITFVLRFPQNAVTLAALPWELLHDGHDFLLLRDARQPNSLERYLITDRALTPPAAERTKLHLLALLPEYGIDATTRAQEQQARRAVWDTLRNQGQITYDELTPLTRKKLIDYLHNSTRPDVVHYYGHGSYKNGHGFLQFDSEGGGKSEVSADQLRRIFGDVRLIVMHACQSSMVDEQGGLLSGIAPSLSIVAGAVVAMQLSIRMSAATYFDELFYNEVLIKERSIQQAVATARQALQFIEEDASSWFVPNLYIRGHKTEPVYIRPPRKQDPEDPPLEPKKPVLVQAIKNIGVLQLTLQLNNDQVELMVENQGSDLVSELRLFYKGTGVIVTPKQHLVARLESHQHTALALALAPAGQAKAQMSVDISYRAGGRIQEQWVAIPVYYTPATVVAKPPVPTRPPPSASDKKIIQIKRERLEILEQRAAFYGPLADPSISMEIKQIKNEIRELGG